MVINKSNINAFLVKNNIMYCNSSEIHRIDYVPENITHLYCSHNSLTKLPKLPNGLKVLECNYNNLTYLPILPDTLERLDCDGNELIDFPKNPVGEKWIRKHNRKLKLRKILNI
jgi:Leucine-rich repeat (LRR) protein